MSPFFALDFPLNCASAWILCLFRKCVNWKWHEVNNLTKGQKRKTRERKAGQNKWSGVLQFFARRLQGSKADTSLLNKREFPSNNFWPSFLLNKCSCVGRWTKCLWSKQSHTVYGRDMTSSSNYRKKRKKKHNYKTNIALLMILCAYFCREVWACNRLCFPLGIKWQNK